jgi:hypothetical protein
MAKKPTTPQVVVDDADIITDPNHPAYIRPSDRAKLIAASHEHSRRTNEDRFEWPDPDTLTFDDDGFSQEEFASTYSDQLGFDRRSRRNRGRNRGRQGQQQPRSKGKSKGKGGNSGGSGGGNQKLPNPSTVETEVRKSLSALPKATNTGPLQYFEFNGLFLDITKYKYFKGAYHAMSERFHAIFLSEVEPAAIQQWATDVGYTCIAGKANTRNQAVCILLNPNRLKVIRQWTIPEIGTVQGVPDLREAVCVEVEDVSNGERHVLVVVHLKSMRGGPAVTAKVRYRQCELLEQKLGANFSGYIAGDWNLILDDPKVTDADPLKNAGYALVFPNDHSATHAMGSRIDGFFKRGIKHKVGNYQTRQYWTYPGVGRNFSDHALSNIICDPATTGEGELTGSDPVVVKSETSVEEVHLAAGFSLSKLELLKRGLY